MVTPVKIKSEDTGEKFTFRQVSDLSNIIVGPLTWLSLIRTDNFCFNTEFQLQMDFTVVVYV